MKNPFRQKLGILFLLLAVGLFLGNKVLACVIPSMESMDNGQAMSCCADQCRQETSPEEAQKACDQSHIAWLKEGLAGAVLIDPPSLQEISSPVSLSAVESSRWHLMTQTPLPRVHGPPYPSSSLERRILIQSFLI